MVSRRQILNRPIIEDWSAPYIMVEASKHFFMQNSKGRIAIARKTNSK
jgi:hypothetical protein